METLSINYQSTNLEIALQAIGRLSKSEFDSLLLQIKKLRIKNYPVITSKKENELLKTINSSLPATTNRIYENLLTKKQKGVLSDNEYAELLDITEQREALQEEKLRSMIELAKLRNTTLDEIVEQLQLKKELYVA